MKRSGIMNPQLNRVLGMLGHTDRLVISDCGLPIPPEVERVDLALVRGEPRFLPVAEAITRELVIQRATVAEEMRAQNPSTLDGLRGHLEGVPIDEIAHEELKARLTGATAVVRTGEATPFANVVLECGVAF